MTTISYNIASQLTGNNITTTDWSTAKTLQQSTMREECIQLGWFAVTAVVTNNDGTITMCAVNDDGVPLEDGTPYIDNTSP